MPQSAKSTRAKTAKTPYPQHFGTAAASLDRLKGVNAAAGGRRSSAPSLTEAMSGSSRKPRINPVERNTLEPESLQLTPRCGAKRRDGLPCQKPRAKGRSRCQLHGVAPGSGAPKGEANGRYSHGLLTAEAIEERSAILTIFRRSIR